MKESTIRVNLEKILRNRFFFSQSFELYGGLSGFYDYGPVGCSLKLEVEKHWRSFFLKDKNINEISTSILSPYNVFKSSGHTDKFTDFIVKDVISHDSYRADKLLEDFFGKYLSDNHSKLSENEKLYIQDVVASVNSLSADKIHFYIQKYSILSPNGNNLTFPKPFNLMFSTIIGSKEKNTNSTDNTNLVYLRPETAQGIFVNFNKFLENSQLKIPFGIAQIGKGFRNEISPRNGLLRLREFDMAEIEYFYDPESAKHENMFKLDNLFVNLIPKNNIMIQENKVKVLRIGLRDAIQQNIIENEIMAYFLGRSVLFMISCGINDSQIRLRQHCDDEKAHYASDSWDVEISTSFGWIECAGIANRSSYDLQKHSAATNTCFDLVRDAKESVSICTVVPKYNKPLMGKTFKKNHEKIIQYIDEACFEEKKRIDNKLSLDGKCEIKLQNGEVFSIVSEMVSFSYTQKEKKETFIPHVIEPSFGISRILYCILENTLRQRNISEADERFFFAFPPHLAPIKCSILTLSKNEKFSSLVRQIEDELSKFSISYKEDDSNTSIGKRYARMDEIGIPYSITLDFQSLNSNIVTLREINSMEQVLVNITEIGQTIFGLLNDQYNWNELSNRLPKL